MLSEVTPVNSSPRRTWPWVIAAVLALGVVVATIWVRAEVRRIHDRRDPMMPAAAGALR